MLPFDSAFYRWIWFSQPQLCKQIGTPLQLKRSYNHFTDDLTTHANDCFPQILNSRDFCFGNPKGASMQTCIDNKSSFQLSMNLFMCLSMAQEPPPVLYSIRGKQFE